MKLAVTIPAAIGLLLTVYALFAGDNGLDDYPFAKEARPGPAMQSTRGTSHAWNLPVEEDASGQDEAEAFADPESDVEAEPDAFLNEDQPLGPASPSNGAGTPLPAPQLSAAGPAVHYPDPALLER